MSFGFGFALPAYPLRGGTGNNPFNQLGPTLDLSFVDGATNVGDQLGADTYTLNTDFITPEYQVAAQYAVWENGVGLAQKTFAQIVTFTRTGSTATYFNSAGVLTAAAADQPRFDYNPSTLAARGLLIEEARTNLQVNSENPAGTGWTPTELTVSLNATTAPSGVSNAAKLVPSINNLVHVIEWTATVVASTQYIASVFLKAAEETVAVLWNNVGGSIATFDLSAGTITSGSGTITSVGNGWYRCSISYTPSGINGQIRTYVRQSTAYAGDGTSGLFIWGAQLEAGAFPTSYIPTTTTALTRSADVASVNTLSPWYNATESTLFVEATARLGITQGFVLLEGTAGAGMRVRKSSANLYSAALREPTNRDITLTPSPALVEGQTIKEALAIKQNDCALSGGGQSPNIQTTFTIPAITALVIGGSIASGELFANSWIRRITYYPRRLSNADLQSITV